MRGCLVRIRRAAALSAAGAFLALALAGCGGGSGTGFDIDGRPISSAPSPFAGCWSGTWIASGSEQGTLDATISAEGRLTFTLSDRSTGATHTGSGSITRSGALLGSYRGPSGAVLTQKGSVTVAANGHLLGQFETFEGQARVGMGTFDLLRCGS
jgi:hypothetical protein